MSHHSQLAKVPEQCLLEDVCLIYWRSLSDPSVPKGVLNATGDPFRVRCEEMARVSLGAWYRVHARPRTVRWARRLGPGLTEAGLNNDYSILLQ